MDRVCFSRQHNKGHCVKVAGALKRHFKALHKARRVTIQALDDDAFAQMDMKKKESLFNDKKARDHFLLQHIFLGILRHQHDNSRLIAASARHGHPVSEMLWNEGKPVVSSASDDEPVFAVDRVIKVKEGLLQILKRVD